MSRRRSPVDADRLGLVPGEDGLKRRGRGIEVFWQSLEHHGHRAASYVFEDAPIAMAELLRVTRPGGVVLASVMSTLGTYRYYIRGVVDDIARHGSGAISTVLRTGDLRPTHPTGHMCQKYRSDQVPPLVARGGGELAVMSASNLAALGNAEVLARLEADPRVWRRFLDDEAWACRQPGVLGGAATSCSRPAVPRAPPIRARCGRSSYSYSHRLASATISGHSLWSSYRRPARAT
jgi:hypothetical protein